MYSTAATVTAQLGQFSSLIIGTMNSAAIEAIISEADALIDGYIVAAVALPFSATPKLITKISTDISVRMMWALKQAKDIPSHVKDDYDNALKLLSQLAKGTLKLSATDAASDTFFDLKYSAAPRNFTVLL
jgi:phage gp36-like protein